MILLKKAIKYEFWPFWLFYIPVGFYGLILSLRARSITFFTTVNPCMEYSGGLEYSKMEYFQLLTDELLRKTVLINKDIETDNLNRLIEEESFSFPLIIKPDKGQRGVEVQKINDINALKLFLSSASRQKFLLQEFIDYPIELGVFIIKTPDGKRREITSVTKKKFLTIKGDGESTFKNLVVKNIRAVNRKNEFEKKYKLQWNTIVEKNKEIILEPIGNHNRGTEFIDANDLISNELLEVMDRISLYLPEFYYGRIDLKTKSIDDLYKGKNIKLLEINGVNSEPSHIYDKNISILTAYKDLFKHMNIMYEISRQNKITKGIKHASFKEILKGIYKLYNY